MQSPSDPLSLFDKLPPSIPGPKVTSLPSPVSDSPHTSLPPQDTQLSPISLPSSLPDVSPTDLLHQPHSPPDDSHSADQASGVLTRTEYFSRQSDIPLDIPGVLTAATTEQNPRVREMAKRAIMFLETLLLTTCVTEASKASGMSGKTAYRWKHANQAFSDAWDEAVSLGYEALRGEMVRRARDGIVKPVYQKGGLVGYERVYSDNLAMFLSKGRWPDEFREKEAAKDTGMTINYNIHGVVRDPVEDAKAIDVTNPEPESDNESTPPRS